MAIKDYYAILMVHPKAETFVIEAAYKRLAREYHPDFTDAPDNHEKMVEINEAYEILSDPGRRRKYDKEYERQARSDQLSVIVANAPAANNAVEPQNTTKTPKKTTDPRWGTVGPVRPDPASFGIDADYLERAIEGAQVWKLREDRIPGSVKWITRIICCLVGFTISILLFRTQWREIALFAWFVLPLLGELSIRLIERVRDAHLLRYKFNPLYNPNPAGYKAYAREHAKYEADTVNVYVSRDAVYHAKKTCPGLSGYEPMPKWFAISRNAKPCSRCGRFSGVEAKRLPPPFGKGELPADVT